MYVSGTNPSQRKHPLARWGVFSEDVLRKRWSRTKSSVSTVSIDTQEHRLQKKEPAHLFCVDLEASQSCFVICSPHTHAQSRFCCFDIYSCANDDRLRHLTFLVCNRKQNSYTLFICHLCLPPSLPKHFISSSWIFDCRDTKSMCILRAYFWSRSRCYKHKHLLKWEVLFLWIRFVSKIKEQFSPSLVYGASHGTLDSDKFGFSAFITNFLFAQTRVKILTWWHNLSMHLVEKSCMWLQSYPLQVSA